MKSIVILSGLASCLAFTHIYADSNFQLNTAKNNSQQMGKIRLDQSNNIVFEQFSSNAFPLNLLQVKHKFNNKDLVVGGSAQFDFQHWQGNKIVTTPLQEYDQSTQGYFTQLTIDVMSNMNNDWSTIFLSLADSHIGQNDQNGNYVYVPQAFLLFGNLDKTPLYLTLGIDTIPFGVFTGSGQWNMPLTASYFNPAQSPLASIGFYKYNLNAVITEYEDQSNFTHHTVYSLYYNNHIHSFNYGIGTGYLTHLQSNSTGNAGNNPRRNRIISPFNFGNALDFNANIGYGPFALTGETVSGSHKAGINRGKPQAFAESITYTHVLFGKDATFGIGHSHSLGLHDVPTTLEGQDAIPLAASGMKNAWVLSVTRPVINKYFSLGFDAEKDELYDKKRTYTYTLDLIAYL